MKREISICDSGEFDQSNDLGLLAKKMHILVDEGKVEYRDHSIPMTKGQIHGILQKASTIRNLAAHPRYGLEDGPLLCAIQGGVEIFGLLGLEETADYWDTQLRRIAVNTKLRCYRTKEYGPDSRPATFTGAEADNFPGHHPLMTTSMRQLHNRLYMTDESSPSPHTGRQYQERRINFNSPI